jgi:hypothetical protein
MNGPALLNPTLLLVWTSMNQCFAPTINHHHHYHLDHRIPLFPSPPNEPFPNTMPIGPEIYTNVIRTMPQIPRSYDNACRIQNNHPSSSPHPPLPVAMKTSIRLFNRDSISASALYSDQLITTAKRMYHMILRAV